MAGVLALVLAAAATVADAPRQTPSSAATTGNATVTIIRAERVTASPEITTASHSVRRKAGKISVDFH